MKTLTPLFPWRHSSQERREAELAAYVDGADFPCVGAKAALARGALQVLACSAIDSAWDDVRIHDALLAWVQNHHELPGQLHSFAVVFDGPRTLTEGDFEGLMWSRLQSISDKDVWRGQDYDHRVSADPKDAKFSLSFGGEAFFVVGLHPLSSRPARRFSLPAMIFNLHDQFEKLRLSGKYETMREKIMARDEALSGTRNPMLAAHGDDSAARQYSGRAVGTEWQCPFHYRGSDV